MSAIEMMEPKMDAGMICNRIDRPVYGFDEAVKRNLLKINDLTYEEKIGIIDDTTSCLVSWLEGHSLALTVLTNLYLHCPNKIEDNFLRSFSLCILKVVELSREFIVKAEAFEEEDFQPSLYNFKLTFGHSEAKICSFLKECEDELMKKSKCLSKNKQSTQVDNQVRLVDGCYARIRFYRSLLVTLVNIARESLFSSAESKSRTNAPSGTLVEETQKHLTICTDMAKIWRDTVDLGVKAAVSQEDSKSASNDEARADYPTIMGFEPLINQRLLLPTFPRYTKLRSREDSVEYVTGLVQRLQYVVKVKQVPCFHRALDFFCDFGRFKGRNCVLSRAILQMIYVPHACAQSRDYFPDLLENAVNKFIRPPCVQLQSKFTSQPLFNGAGQALESFMAQSIRPMMCLLQIQGHNRARQREKLVQLLEELNALQGESERVDAYLNKFTQKLDPPVNHNGYFSTWVLYHTVRVMIQYVLSGFELELYSCHEYPYIFWYLHDFLFAWLVSTVNRASTLSEEQKNLEQAKNKNSKKAKNKKKSKDKMHSREVIWYQALQQLCGGFYQTTMAFKMQGKLKEPSVLQLSSEKVRYEHRFMPLFNVVVPPPIPYEQYQEMRDQLFSSGLHSPRYLYSCAQRCFEDARRLLELVPEPDEEVMLIALAYFHLNHRLLSLSFQTSSCLRVAKTNIVVTKLLATDVKQSKVSVICSLPFA